MKKLIVIIITSTLALLLNAAEEPDWVSYFKQNGTIKNYKDYYFGVGSSQESESKADDKALETFSRCIKTIVQSEIKSHLQEKNGKVKDKFSKKINISTDVGLRGLSITGRFFDGSTFFSIIKYKKKEYNSILREEIIRDIERQQLELEKKILQNKLDEKAKQEEIRKEKEKKKIKDELDDMKNKFMLNMRNKYPDFFDSAPPYKTVSFRNAQLIPNDTQINVKAGLFPLSLEEIFAAHKFWLFEFSVTAAFEDNKYDRQEAQLKYQILPYSGKFYKFSAAFGFAAYNSSLRDSSFFDADLLITPFIAGNMTLPNLHFSFASVYADLGKACLGINNYLFYKQMKDRLSLIIELDYIYDKNLRNRHDDALVFQPAVKFKTTKNLFSTFSYEDNKYWIISIEIGF